MDNALDSDIGQAGGWLTVIASVSLSAIEWISQISIDDALQGVLAVLGIVFLSYKVLTQRIVLRSEKLENRIKEEKLKQLKKENEDASRESKDSSQ